MGKGTKSNISKGKQLMKNRKTDKKKRGNKVKMHKMLKKNPKLQKLLLAALVQQLKDSSSSSSSSEESSDDMVCPAGSSPLDVRGRLSPEPTTSADENGEEGEAGREGNLLDSPCISPTTCPNEAEEEAQISLPLSQSSTNAGCEGEWMTDCHAHSPSNVQVFDVNDESDQEAAAAIHSDSESVIMQVDDDEVRELIGSDGEHGDSAPPAPVAGTSTGSNSRMKLLPCAHQPTTRQCDPVPKPVSTYIDKYGVTKLVVDPSASPFLVRNQMLERGLQHQVSYDQSVIERGTATLRPCIPYQNGTCHRILPLHGSAATDLMFSHICLFCLYRGSLPIPHPLIECPFVIDINNV